MNQVLRKMEGFDTLVTAITNAVNQSESGEGVVISDLIDALSNVGVNLDNTLTYIRHDDEDSTVNLYRNGELIEEALYIFWDTEQNEREYVEYNGSALYLDTLTHD